ncbi:MULTISPECIES: sugar phosphate nucleotidyltransferase [Haloarcula]|uniref:Bifunctional protein GlmU n=1 Tax=Haloarcula pellucida TaxID=1427151 RepID=A0A830GQC2_9EURY|nr:MULTISPECIES: sugar phosphate nucleotidyltransferase [Halomicroarcula]MBX0350232.1 NTP transferase domain-containing protein [Halomicroarcula pellucida]MDS0277666.1 sugar phosphate nucleotidyltransferase [Halomicroarcula sp. S1AR25-4]GGO01031.1 glucose-1-phosphate thymidylyltransferase [Halomicroarcula pellucida]
MQAVILAAGEGQRLGPLTEGRPKPMVPVGNQPILESVLEAAVEAGADEIVLVVGHARERIQSHFGDGDEWGVPIRYVVQNHQLGAAHALAQTESVVDGPFLVLHGDQLVDADLLADLLERWERTERATIAAVQSDRPTEYGAVAVDGESVVAVSKDPTDDPPFLVNAGAYVFDSSVFDVVRDIDPAEGQDYGMATTLQRLADDGSLSAVLHRGTWQDLTYPWDLLTTNAALLRRRDDDVDGAAVHDSAAVADDVALDEGVTVGPNATLLPGTALGRNVRVGANATLSNCIVMAGARIGDGAVLNDCIVGESVSVGPNATAEGGPARVVVGETVHDDVGLGAVLADRTTLRGGVTVAPGTVVGREVLADCGTVLRGRIDSGDTIRRG